MSEVALFSSDRFYRSQFQTGQASYTVFQKDGVTYADPGYPGGTPYSSTDASTIIQNALAALSSGRILLKAGTYNLATTLTLGTNIGLFGEQKQATVLN